MTGLHWSKGITCLTDMIVRYFQRFIFGNRDLYCAASRDDEKDFFGFKSTYNQSHHKISILLRTLYAGLNEWGKSLFWFVWRFQSQTVRFIKTGLLLQLNKTYNDNDLVKRVI